VILAEQIESLQRRGKRMELGGGPGLDAGVLVRPAQHERRGARRLRPAGQPQRGTERRRDRDAALEVQAVLMGAQEMRHPPGLPVAVAVAWGRAP